MTQKVRGKLARFGLKKRSTKKEGKQGQCEKEVEDDSPAWETSEFYHSGFRRTELNLSRYTNMSNRLVGGF